MGQWMEGRDGPPAKDWEVNYPCRLKVRKFTCTVQLNKYNDETVFGTTIGYLLTNQQLRLCSFCVHGKDHAVRTDYTSSDSFKSISDICSTYVVCHVSDVTEWTTPHLQVQTCNIKECTALPGLYISPHSQYCNISLLRLVRWRSHQAMDDEETSSNASR